MRDRGGNFQCRQRQSRERFVADRADAVFGEDDVFDVTAEIREGFRINDASAGGYGKGRSAFHGVQENDIRVFSVADIVLF